MNNAQKQHISDLERRILRLETALEVITQGLQYPQPPDLACTQCNTSIYEGHTCRVVGCCQGLNPDDDLIPQS